MEILILSLLAVGFASGFLFIRENSVRKKKVKLFMKIPSQEMLLWVPRESIHIPEGESTVSYIKKNTTSLKEAGIIGAIGSVPSLYYLSQIDENTYDGMQFAFNNDLTNFNDLHNYVEDKYMSIFNTDTADGWVTRLEGYVTEQYAADVLTSLGYEVAFPENANQQGYDLLVDGEPWQVKGGETISVVKDHFTSNPDIPVITNQELAEQFGPSNLVLGSDALDPVTMEGVTLETLSGIDKLGDSIGTGIPLITLITTGYREFGLISSGKTDLTHSAKHVGLDLVGTGGGGFAGAQAGAFVGAIGGPVGAAIGGVIGGIVGAIGGRHVSNSIKLEPYNRALENYQSTFFSTKRKLVTFHEKQRNYLERSFIDVNNDLNERRTKIVEVYNNKMKEQLLNLTDSKHKFVNETPVVLTSIKQQLSESEAQLTRKIKRSSLLRRILLPTTEDIYFEEAKNWFQNRYHVLDQAIAKFTSLSFQSLELRLQYEEIMQFMQSFVIENNELNTSLRSILDVHHSGEIVRTAAKKQLFSGVAKAESEIRDLTKETLTIIANFITEQKVNLKKHEDKINIEKDRLGI